MCAWKRLGCQETATLWSGCLFCGSFDAELSWLSDCWSSFLYYLMSLDFFPCCLRYRIFFFSLSPTRPVVMYCFLLVYFFLCSLYFFYLYYFFVATWRDVPELGGLTFGTDPAACCTFRYSDNISISFYSPAIHSGSP